MSGVEKVLLEVRRLEKYFALDDGFLETISLQNGRIVRKQGRIHAVNDISFSIQRGETLFIVGESGCGKSTVARLVAGLLKPSSGAIYFEGMRMDNNSRKAMAPLIKKVQMIFQNTYASLNPRMNIRQSLQEPVKHHFTEKKSTRSQ